MATTNPTSFGMVNPAIFEHLQAKIDEDTQVREELRSILRVLERQGRAWVFLILGSAILILQSKSNAIGIVSSTFDAISTVYV